MRVGIDARLHYYTQGGIANYAQRLIWALARLDSIDQFVVLQSRHEPEPLVEQANFRCHASWSPPHHRLEQYCLPLELAHLGLDVLHSVDFIPPFRRRCRSVITVHDLAFLLHPHLVTKESQRYYGQIRRAVASAEGIIAVSEATRQDLQRLLGVRPEDVDVVHHAPDSHFQPIEDKNQVVGFCEQRGLPLGFLLWVGVMEPRKNLPTLLKALALLKGRWTDGEPRLVLAGRPGWLYQDALRLVDELQLSSNVIQFEPQSTNDLLMLYNGASILVFPSLYEGFGFPPLEAMACGTPVISSNTPALVEVQGDASLYVEPLDEEVWAQTIYRLWNDEVLRDQLSEKGLVRAGQYTWRNSAEKTLAVYRKAAGM
jgi:glycosyltransferase involved in cell wall biosynthesis